MPQGMAPPKRAAGKQSTCVLSFPALYIFLKAVRTRDPADLIPFAQFRFRVFDSKDEKHHFGYGKTAVITEVSARPLPERSLQLPHAVDNADKRR